MNTKDFIVEYKGIGEDASAMHQDHEVQMARADCYHAAKYAIELHKMLSHVSELEGIDGWVAEKLTLACDYLRTVHEYLDHEIKHNDQPKAMPEVFETAEAEAKFAELLESNLDETSSAGIATAMGKMNPGAGTLFGGSYKQKDSPFQDAFGKRKKPKVIKRQ